MRKAKVQCASQLAEWKKPIWTGAPDKAPRTQEVKAESKPEEIQMQVADLDTSDHLHIDQINVSFPDDPEPAAPLPLTPKTFCGCTFKTWIIIFIILVLLIVALSGFVLLNARYQWIDFAHILKFGKPDENSGHGH